MLDRNGRLLWPLESLNLSQLRGLLERPILAFYPWPDCTVDEWALAWYALQMFLIEHDPAGPIARLWHERAQRLYNDYTARLYTWLKDYTRRALLGELRWAPLKAWPESYCVEGHDCTDECPYWDLCAHISRVADSLDYRYGEPPSRRNIYESSRLPDWETVLDLALYYFGPDFDWAENYGGRAWHQIAQAWRDYQDRPALMVDLAFSLEHNNNIYLDKSPKVPIDGLRAVLDAKFEATSLSDLFCRLGKRMGPCYRLPESVYPILRYAYATGLLDVWPALYWRRADGTEYKLTPGPIQRRIDELQAQAQADTRFEQIRADLEFKLQAAAAELAMFVPPTRGI